MLAIAIHGGAGTISRAEVPTANEVACRAGLAEALDAGYAVLEREGSSLEAVACAVRALEDNPLFNAGRGAVLAHDGWAELDAAIMDGKELRAGAVAGLRHIKNPIELARLILEHSPHVLLVGEGAEEFALEQDIALVARDYFCTEARQRELKRVLSGTRSPRNELAALGTVGAVARDHRGNLAAATSTGGMTNKRRGRVGDSPIIGAGTYADNRTAAVSATGHGEFFIRHVVAHDICARIAYGQLTLARAAREVVQQRLKSLGAEGGVIAVDAAGEVVMEFNSDGMYRAARTSAGWREIAIFRDR